MILKIFALVVLLLAVVVLVRLFMLGQVSQRAPDLGLVDGELRPCPGKPNCVSSRSRGRSHAISPIALDGPAERAMRLAGRVIESMPGGHVTTLDGRYLRAEFTSRLFGFVDDLELLWSEDEQVVHVRSASRVGNSDLGANRRRVELLRQRLVDSEQDD